MFENGKQRKFIHGAGLCGHLRGVLCLTGMERSGSPYGFRKIRLLALGIILSDDALLHLDTASRESGSGGHPEKTLHENEKMAALPFSNNIQGHSSRGPFYLQTVQQY